MDPMLISFKKLYLEKMNPETSLRSISGTELGLTNYLMKKGGLFSMTGNKREQILYLLCGQVKVKIGEKEYILKEGDGIIIPPQVAYTLEALEESSLLDAYNLPRQPWWEENSHNIEEESFNASI